MNTDFSVRLSNTVQEFLAGKLAGKYKRSLQLIGHIDSFDSRWGYLKTCHIVLPRLSSAISSKHQLFEVASKYQRKAGFVTSDLSSVDYLSSFRGITYRASMELPIVPSQFKPGPPGGVEATWHSSAATVASVFPEVA